VTGAGFTPGEAVFIQIPAPGGLAGFVETTVTPTGTIAATVEHAPYTKVVKYAFAGFRPGKPIFGHYSAHGKVVLTHKFGKATGPRGILHTKAKLFPGHGSPGAKYKVRFDDSKKLNPKATPKIVTGLGAF
jgi:hypothetical protein